MPRKNADLECIYIPSYGLFHWQPDARRKLSYVIGGTLLPGPELDRSREETIKKLRRFQRLIARVYGPSHNISLEPILTEYNPRYPTPSLSGHSQSELRGASYPPIDFAKSLCSLKLGKTKRTQRKQLRKFEPFSEFIVGVPMGPFYALAADIPTYREHPDRTSFGLDTPQERKQLRGQFARSDLTKAEFEQMVRPQPNGIFRDESELRYGYVKRDILTRVLDIIIDALESDSFDKIELVRRLLRVFYENSELPFVIWTVARVGFFDRIKKWGSEEYASIEAEFPLWRKFPTPNQSSHNVLDDAGEPLEVELVGDYCGDADGTTDRGIDPDQEVSQGESPSQSASETEVNEPGEEFESGYEAMSASEAEVSESAEEFESDDEAIGEESSWLDGELETESDTPCEVVQDSFDLRYECAEYFKENRALTLTFKLGLKEPSHQASTMILNDMWDIIELSNGAPLSLTTIEEFKKHILKLARQEMSKQAPIIRQIEACENNCCAFTREYATARTCHLCGSSRKDAYFFYFFSPRGMIKRWFEDKTLAEHMRKVVHSTEPGMASHFGGELIKTLKQRHISAKQNGGNESWDHSTKYFEESADTVHLSFTLLMDNVNPFSQITANMSTYALVCNNLPPDVRYEEKYVQVCMVHPKIDRGHQYYTQRKDITEAVNSFLSVIVDEFAGLSVNGLKDIWDASTNASITVRAHLTVISGDMPATASLMGMTSHGCRKPCRACHAQRTSARPSNISGDQAPTGISNRDFENIEIRTHGEHVGYLLPDPLPDDELDKLGINGYSCFLDLGSVIFPWSFQLDLMHMAYVNSTKKLISLLRSTIPVSKRGQMDNILSSFQMDDIVSSLQGTAHAVGDDEYPTDFFLQRRDTSKVVMWMNVVRHIPLLIEFCWSASGFSNQIDRNTARLRNAIFELLDVLRCYLSPQLPLAALEEMGTRTGTALVTIEEITNDVSYLTLPMHSLLHAHDYARWVGPPQEHWCYTMDNECRRIKLYSRACSFIAINRRLLFSYLIILATLEPLGTHKEPLPPLYGPRRRSPRLTIVNHVKRLAQAHLARESRRLKRLNGQKQAAPGAKLVELKPIKWFNILRLSSIGLGNFAIRRDPKKLTVVRLQTATGDGPLYGVVWEFAMATFKTTCNVVENDQYEEGKVYVAVEKLSLLPFGCLPLPGGDIPLQRERPLAMVARVPSNGSNNYAAFSVESIKQVYYAVEAQTKKWQRVWYLMPYSEVEFD